MSHDRGGAGMSYPEELGRELAAVGIGGRLRQRITAEVRDHLECDPSADLGSPAAIAAQFADELGTVRTRRAAFAAFGVLALAGVLFVAAGLTAVSGFPHRHPHSVLLGDLGAVLAALGGQIALVTGTLAAERGLRRRAASVFPARRGDHPGQAGGDRAPGGSDGDGRTGTRGDRVRPGRSTFFHHARAGPDLLGDGGLAGRDPSGPIRHSSPADGRWTAG